MVVLYEVDFSSDDFVEFFLVEAFHKEATFVGEYFGLEDEDIWDFSFDDIHINFSLLLRDIDHSRFSATVARG